MASSEPFLVPTAPQQADVPPLAARPWQFRLRMLLVSIVALSGLLAIMHRIGMVWSVMLLWVVLLGAAHVIGNAFGTRNTRRLRGREPSDDELPSERYCGGRPVFAPTTQLGSSRRLGWLKFVFIGAGALVGAFCGIAALRATGQDAAWRNIALGGVSAAGLGAFLAFVASSFVRVFYRALREAARSAGR